MKTLLAILFSASLMLAQGPSFESATFYTAPSGIGWFAWDESGVPTESNVTYSLTVNQTSYWACATGNPGSYFYTKSINYTQNSFLNVTENANQDEIYGQAGLEAYVPKFSCPANQQEILACVYYHNPKIQDISNGIAATPTPADYEVVTAFPKLSGC